MPTAIARAWVDDARAEWDREARSYGPDADDDTQEIEVPIVVREDDGDADLRGLHLTFSQWEAVDRLTAVGVPVRVVGSHCAHVPMDPADRVTTRYGWYPLAHVLREERWGGDDDTEPQYHFRPSPVLGGVFLIFPEGA